ncbi:MAG: hypothetical protein CMJ24_01230 [Phycisphaerae bacterium]|nr:hypothetical protein [Phycisphaerae bacterium]MDG1898327.1 hypothetical protein [Phycisphaerales bacterium]|tara:strand:+ start:580 stop:777 length:198 start_codon:yes stop_codon:yes gene_type:complete
MRKIVLLRILALLIIAAGAAFYPGSAGFWPLSVLLVLLGLGMLASTNSTMKSYMYGSTHRDHEKQ